MYQNSLFPLRTIVGSAIPIENITSIQKIFESAESKKLEIEYKFSLKSLFIQTASDPSYSSYLPTFDINGTQVVPGVGMDTLPVPREATVSLPPSSLPFDNNDEVVSFFALSKKKKTAADVSRKLSARFAIQLPEKFLVGGICFGGFPYLPYSRPEVQLDGTNSSNFGLPREVRLTCVGAPAADEKETRSVFEFLDSETQATRQTIVSHSGFQFLCVEPTLTGILMVHFSDYPTVLKRAKFNNYTGKITQTLHYGFIIPYFYVFEYKEKTRYRPAVSAGILGTNSNKEPRLNMSQVTTANAFNDNVEYRHVVDGRYYDFTAESIFGQQRTYVVGEKRELLEECFISTEIPPNKSVVLYIEQGEDNERCVAGLKILLPFIPETNLSDEEVERIRASVGEFLGLPEAITTSGGAAGRSQREKRLREFLRIPPKIDFCEKIGIRVYEIDPLEGVSPLSVPLDGKYATLLAEQDIDDAAELALASFIEGVKFVRPSNSKYFAVELTNLDSKPGQFVIKGLRLIQSAHVSVHPRAARTQQVRTLNFRIIGANLAEDYALLGNDGFNFSIERFVAGERKSVLFRANSLLDLLHTGAAKIFSNVRRRAVEFEKTEHGGSVNERMGEKGEDYEERYTESRMTGWRRSETGDGVEAMVQATPERDWYDYGVNESPHGISKIPGAFGSHANQETRTHTQLLYPETEPWVLLKNWFDFVRLLATPVNELNPELRSSVPSLLVGFPFWRGINLPSIEGFRQIAASPGSISEAEARTLANSPNPVKALLDLINPINSISRLLPLMLYGGTSGSFNESFGASAVFVNTGVGLGLGMTPVPVLTHNVTVGSQGSVTKQATRTGHSDSQYLNNSLDEGNTYSSFRKGEMKRLVTRKEVPDTDRQRVKGAEVMWQGELADIITGSIPLNFTLPATAGKMHFRTSDDSLRVRFGSGVGNSISVDFWFDLTEEMVKDDN